MRRRTLSLAVLTAVIACTDHNPTEPPAPRVRYIAVAAAHHRTCVLDEAGTLYCWGLKDEKAGPDLIPVRRATVEPLVSIIAEDYFFCGQGVSGALHCWGEYEEDTFHHALSINQVPGSTLLHGVAMSAGHVCGLVADSTVQCLGVQISGRTGRPWADTSHQVRHDFSLAPIPSSWRFIALGAGEYHTCGIRPTREVACWGDSLRVGNPAGPFLRQRNPCISVLTSRPCTLEPVPVPGISEVTSLAVGSNQVCVLAAGRVFCWGYNGNDELGFRGDHSAIPLELPVPMQLRSLEAGASTTCGLGTNGKVICWGSHYGAPIGPTVVPGNYPAFSAISVGAPHSCGLADGEVYCWSRHTTYLGDGKEGVSLTPVRVAQPEEVRDPT